MQKIFLACTVAILVWAGQAGAGTYVNTSVPFNWIDATGHTKVGPTTGGVYGPFYKFNNVGGCGTTPPTIDDTLSDQIPFGFSFIFGGQTFDSLRIMSNGRLQLTSQAAPASDNITCGFGSPVTQLPFPNAGLNNTLRIYGNDLDPTLKSEVAGYATLCTSRATCFVSYASIGTAPNRRFVVTWSNVPEWTNASTTGGNYNLQVILQENGEFIYQFGTDVAGPAAATAQVGWQVSTADYDVPQVGFPANNTAIKFFIPTPLAQYRMEQAIWSGVSGEVLDTSGNGRNASAVGGAQTMAGGKVCRGANIPQNANTNNIDAIDTGIDMPATVGGVGTITFWYKANSAWSGGGTQDAQLLDATVVNNQWFFLVRRNTGQLRFVITDSTGTVRVAQTSAIAVASGTWKHVAVSWNFNALAGTNQDHMLIYVDGVLQTTLAFTTAGTLSSQIGTLYVGDNRSTFTGSNGTGRSTDGVIDEFRIYNYEGGVGLVQQDMNATYPCVSISNFQIDIGAASASTCLPKNITITARDSSNGTLTTYAGTVNIATSANHGDWSIVTANGVLNNGTADDGAATYTFVTGDNGVITLALGDAHADDTTVSVADSSTPATLSASGILNFRDNVLVITPDTIQVAGRDQATSVALWKKDISTGNCAINTAYTGSKALDAWITRDALDPAGAAPTIGALSLPGGAPASNPASNNLNLTFTNGQANFNLSTTDVGKYVLNMRDDTRSFATGVDISGASNMITTRPFALGFTNIKQGAIVNPAGAAKFVAAEDSFQATVGAYLWQAADDLNNDGLPDAGANVTDNGLTPAFAWAVTLSAVTPITPVGGSAGTLGGGVNIAQAGFAGGVATVSNLTYNQVGTVTLSGLSTGYLGSPFNVTSAANTPVVGRFYPDHFALTTSTLTAACNGFTYMNQGALGISFILQAQGKSNGLTSNYSTALGYPVTTVTPVAENANGGADLGSRITWSTAAWSGGQYIAISPASTFLRNATPDGPYDLLAIGVKAVDADGAVILNRDMNAATTGNCAGVGNCDAKQIGGMPTMVRFGRLRLQNANGSQLLPLNVQMQAQYWGSTGAGSSFLTNTADSCTALVAANVALGNYQKNLNACETSIAVGSFASGRGTVQLSAPGNGNNGSVDLTANLGAVGSGTTCIAGIAAPVTGANRTYLQGNWSGGAYDQNPTARAAFGIYRGEDETIFIREKY